MPKKKKVKRSSGKNLFSVAARNKAFKSAKRAQAKAEARSKKAWKKAVATAKRKLRSSRKRR